MKADQACNTVQVLTPADDAHHINKHNFKVPFVCGCRNLGEALRRISEGRCYDPHKGVRPTTGNMQNPVSALILLCLLCELL